MLDNIIIYSEVARGHAATGRLYGAQGVSSYTLQPMILRQGGKNL